MVHVSAGPPAIPDGGIAPVRFCPWPPCGRLPIPCAAEGLTHIHPYTRWVTAQGAPWFPGPTCPAPPGAATCPEPLCMREGLSRASWSQRTPSAGVPPPASLVRAHASVLRPLRASGLPLDPKSWQVAVSPCWEEDLPDVLSAPLSRRAWPPTPAARVVHGPVASHTTSAFPPFGPGRRSTMSVQRLPYGALCEAAVSRACAGPPVCSPPRSLLPLRRTPHGRRGLYVRASRGSLPPYAPDRLAVRIGQLTAEDFHLIRCAALSAAPRTLRLSRARKPQRRRSVGWRASAAGGCSAHSHAFSAANTDAR
jgi:hypothetical protein